MANYSDVAKKLKVPTAKANEIMNRAIKHGQQAVKKKAKTTTNERR